MPKGKTKPYWPPDPKALLRWGMLVGFVLITALIMPRSYFLELDYQIGKPWPDNNLVADFSFPKYKPPKALEAEEIQALARVNPVFLLDTNTMISTRNSILGTLEELGNKLQEYKELAEIDSLENAETLKIQYFLPKFELDPEDVITSGQSVDQWNTEIRKRSERFLSHVYGTGYIDRPKSEFKAEVISLRDGEHSELLVDRQTLLNSSDLPGKLKEFVNGLEEYEANLIGSLLLGSLSPNYLYSDTLTRLEEERAKQKISPVYGMVMAGDEIIQRGQLVTKEADVMLKSYMRVRQEKFGEGSFFSSFLGRIMVFGALTFIMVLFLRTNRPFIFYRNRRMSMILSLFLLMTVILSLLIKLSPIFQREWEIELIYVLPMCALPIMLTAFFDLRLGFVGNILVALFAGFALPNGFEYFFVQFCAGTIASYSLTRLRNRNDFFVTLSWILIAYLVAFMGYNFYSKGNLMSISYGNLILLGLNVLLTVITYPLIYLFEKIFGLTSDLTFVELLDTNHPLIRDLALKAPGTFQHSLQVANLSEAVVNHIGGNSLLTKVGALFHDIGKMKNPTFFIENVQRKDSPHKIITSEQSAQIIISHVTDGVEMARKSNLPAEVISFIRTHHGTSRVEYFYRKWKQDNPGTDVDDQIFRYPGPIPFTREMAVLMIADSCEAACRSMKDPGPESIEAMVESIVEHKVAAGQFANANINFKDLASIKVVIVKQLTSIYHARIEYPAEVV